MISAQSVLHRAQDRATLRRTLALVPHILTAAALLAVALILAHATLQTALALPDLAAQAAAQGQK